MSRSVKGIMALAALIAAAMTSGPVSAGLEAGGETPAAVSSEPVNGWW